MIRALLLLAALASPSLAAAADQGSLATWLRDGYEIKAAFSDNNGGAYIILQKGADAYICHSNPSPRCEKLS